MLPITVAENDDKLTLSSKGDWWEFGRVSDGHSCIAQSYSTVVWRHPDLSFADDEGEKALGGFTEWAGSGAEIRFSVSLQPPGNTAQFAERRVLENEFGRAQLVATVSDRDVHASAAGGLSFGKSGATSKKSPHPRPYLSEPLRKNRSRKNRGIRGAMVSPAKFRIDVDLNDLLMKSSPEPPIPAKNNGWRLPEPVFPQFPEKLADPGPEVLPERRKWPASQVLRAARGWLIPYLRSRLLPGDFHPITAYLFVEYKCNLDCWYCPSYDNR